MMANHTRHFKISTYIKLIRPHMYLEEVDGLFDFFVTGMQGTYDTIPLGSPEFTYLVNRSELDIAFEQQFVTESNMKEYNFNYPFNIDEIIFAVRNPEYSPRILALFQTLSLTVWLSLLASTILFTLVCYVALKHRHTFQDVLLHVLSICLNQEGNVVSKRAGEFILLCTWLVTMAFFALCFKSVLLSFLSFPPLNSVRTVPELAAAIRAGEYEAYTSNYYMPRLLSKSPNEDIRLIGESMLNRDPDTPFIMFLDLVGLSPAFPKKAYVDLRTYMSIPGLYVSKENMLSVIYATYVRNDFCCKDEVDKIVHRYQASGLDTKIRHFREYYQFMDYAHYFQAANLSSLINVEENRKLSMTDLGGAFILLAVGHFLAICVLIIELVMKRREKSLFKKKKDNLRMISLSKRAEQCKHTDPHSNVSHS